jgi:hypothetical protein
MALPDANTAVSSVDCTSRPGSPAPKGSTSQCSVNSVENPTVLRPDDDDATKRLERDAERRTLFERVVNDKLGVPSGYKKVEVLLLRWDEKIDDFEGHGKEVYSPAWYISNPILTRCPRFSDCMTSSSTDSISVAGLQASAMSRIRSLVSISRFSNTFRTTTVNKIY